MSDDLLLVGVAVGRRALRMLSEERELSLFEIIALSTKEVLSIIETSDEPWTALDQVEELERSLR